MRRRVAVVVALVTLAACNRGGLSRSELETRYVDGLIEAGIDETVAECVIGRLFDELGDAELRQFNTEGRDLTEAQQARVAELAVECSTT
jgi:hypothetical protein